MPPTTSHRQVPSRPAPGRRRCVVSLTLALSALAALGAGHQAGDDGPPHFMGGTKETIVVS
jgi:hypothetical protein